MPGPKNNDIYPEDVQKLAKNRKYEKNQFGYGTVSFFGDFSTKTKGILFIQWIKRMLKNALSNGINKIFQKLKLAQRCISKSKHTISQFCVALCFCHRIVTIKNRLF